MWRVIGGILLIVVGSLLIYYHNQLYQLFGDIEWAERNLGESKVVYVLLGVGVIVVGVLIMFWIGGQGPAEVDEIQFGKWLWEVLT